MITTFSGAAVRSEISEAGKFSLDQYQRPSLGLADVALLGEEREQVVGRPGPEDLARLERQLERRRPEVGEQDVQVVRVERAPPRACPSSRNSGWWMTYWSTGAPDATRTATLVPCAPAGPPELLPGRRDRARVAGEDRRRRAARCRRRARARSWRRRRGSRRRAGRARWRAARSAGSRRGSRGPASAARALAQRLAQAGQQRSRPRPATARTRSSGGRRAGTAAPSAGRGSPPSRARRSPGRAAADRRAGRGARRPARRCGRCSRAGRPVSIVGELAPGSRSSPSSRR